MAKPPKTASSTDAGSSLDTRRRFDATYKQEAVALSKRFGVSQAVNLKNAV